MKCHKICASSAAKYSTNTCHIHCVQSQFTEPVLWILLHNSAQFHVAVHLKQFFANHIPTDWLHSPNSLDLTPLDFFFFQNLKMSRFFNISHIQAAVMRELQVVQQDDVSSFFEHLYEHCQQCIESRENTWKAKLVYILKYFILSDFYDHSTYFSATPCIYSDMWNRICILQERL